jgi:hypothetical protein
MQEARPGPGLPERQHAAAGVHRNVSVQSQVLLAHQGHRLARPGKAERLELQHHHDRIVVVCPDEFHGFRADARLPIKIVAFRGDAEMRDHGVAGIGVVALDRAGNEHIGQPQRARAVLGHDQKSLGAADSRHAIEQSERLANRARVEIGLDRQRLAEQRHRVTQAVGALRNADAAEILALGAERVHVVRRDQRKHGVHAAAAVGIDMIAREGERTPR